MNAAQPPIESSGISDLIFDLSKNAPDRIALNKSLINAFKASSMLELGVFRGDYAMEMLKDCPTIEKYYLLDPWRNLSDWNKPFNKDDNSFEQFYQETLEKTDFAKSKRIILRGKTTEVIDQIPDESLDVAYIDGDHTLKGITIDLMKVWPKLKPNGIIIGDDFSSTIWQHDVQFEPTMIYPFAVYFAEAKDVKIYGLPYSQFVIEKAATGFEFFDLSPRKKYQDRSLAFQLSDRLSIKTQLVMNFPRLFDFYRKYIRRS